MPASDPATLSVAAARDAIKSGALSPVELVEACLARIRALDPTLQAWIHVDEAGARTQAALREEEARAGKLRGALHGIPVGIKDIFDVQGMPTTAGAKAWAHRVPVAGCAVRADAPRPRGDRPRQDAHDPVRVSRSRAHAQPVERRAHAGRLVVGLGGRGRRAHGAAGARLADGRLGAATRRLLRRRRLQASARCDPDRWRRAARVVARSRRDLRALGGRPGAGAPCVRHPRDGDGRQPAGPPRAGARADRAR